MSTKSTIGYDEKWHLYEELRDDTVWLAVEGLDYSVGPSRVCVQIPAAAIDAIRKASPRSFPHMRKDAVA